MRMWEKLLKRKPRGDPQNLERIAQIAKARVILELDNDLFTTESKIKPKEN
ncbi:unnamed protein product [marine sediment metagenome]|uniref:Uncharacterized protein n=1 Tax=marine sediment metagenome TaxID=412755 RepID=X1FV64_9ZZZZ